MEPEDKIEAEIEEPERVYKKDHITFVIKNLPRGYSERWAEWCKNHGFEGKHDVAFSVAMELLENKSQKMINLDSRLLTLEKLIQTHDTLIQSLIENNGQEEEPLDANQLARQAIEKKKQKKLEAETNAKKSS